MQKTSSSYSCTAVFRTSTHSTQNPDSRNSTGKPLPFDTPLQFAEVGNLLQSPWKFQRYGQSGLPVSELFPHIGSVVDDISFIKSMHVEQVDHGGAILQLHTGSAVFTRPSLGAWVPG